MTPHIEAAIGEIAKTVIMPGDPLRAKMIADKYLEDAKLVNSVRNMLAYTGKYKGKEITVMGSGMGMPSIGIYSYELYTVYNVENIIRVGTAGAYTADLNLYDIVLAQHSYSESNFAQIQNGENSHVLDGSILLNEKILTTAEKKNIKLTYGTIHSSDVLYKKHENFKELKEQYGCIAGEMESFGLFSTAKLCNKKAACLLTISNSLITNEETSSEERQNSFNLMLELALETSTNL